MAVQLERFSTNPIAVPTTNWWECRAVFNAGVAYYQDKIDMQILFQIYLDKYQ